MMKGNYEKPTVSIVGFEPLDILTESGETMKSFNNEWLDTPGKTI